MTSFATLDIPTPDGPCDAYLAKPDGPGPFPAVLYYMDVGGLRPEIRAAVERLAADGFYVLAPNLLFRSGKAPFFRPEDAGQPGFMEKLFALISTLTPDVVTRDGGVFLDFLSRQPGVAEGPVAIVGYCMSGGMALRLAASYPERIAAAASFHGANLGADDPSSPHHVVNAIRGEVYVGLAAEDFVMPPDQVERLQSALEAAGGRHMVETYPATQHGWTIPGTPVYDRDQAERHWTRLLDLLHRNLAPAPA